MTRGPVRARVARDAARACLHLLYRVRVAGAPNVPTTGPVVLAANHTGYLDGALVFALAPRPSHFLVLAVMFEGVVGRNLVVATGSGVDYVTFASTSRVGSDARVNLSLGDDTMSHAGQVIRRLVVDGNEGNDTFVDLGGTPVNPTLISIETIA